ncbi:T9SS type A sorting domain-containing protein [Bacteroidota bacterium]|nr:T9SS type A sorting domain-containing protein [Bacteroidota bacterium]
MKISSLTFNNRFFLKPLFQKTKSFLFYFVFIICSLNVSAQNTSLISNCGDFVSGPTAWPYVLVATTVDSGLASQGAQTFTINVTTLPSGGADFRVAKTTANGNWFFGPATALTLGSNSITVPAVTFNRAVKFQFSSGAVEFDALSLNGIASSCIVTLPTPNSSLISGCSDFVIGTNTSWSYVLEATSVAAGVSSQGTQTFTMNVTNLPSGGADFRVAKTTANGNWYFGPAIALTLGSNSISVPAVTFNRAVKFQFSSGDVEFNALSLNGVTSSCIAPLPTPPISLISDCGDFVSGPAAWPYVLVATTVDSGLASQSAQTFTINVTTLPSGGADFRVAKTTANGNWFFGPATALTLGSNSITVPAVTFNRAVKFQFSSGAVEFDALSLNGLASSCVCSAISSSTDVIVACDNYTWIDGNTYNISNNTATYLFMNAAGCDSTVTLNLTINNSSSSSFNVAACDSYAWNGNTYTSSGAYTWIGTNAVGCDSSAVLNLTINSSSSSTVSISSCDSLYWNGTTYTASGVYTWTGTNAVGCDSTVTLNLTINNSSSSESITSCDSLFWNGTTYTTSGVYTWTGNNTLGCDSVVTLNLTINNSTISSSSISACDSYNWNGNTYTNSGTYYWTGTSMFGCDSTSILVLSITGNSTSSFVTSCDLYIWNGNTYSSSGTYTYNNGACTDSLILVINNSSSSFANVSACDSYDWNGNTYTSSGTYTWLDTNSVGCDSVVTLNLTINSSSSSFFAISSCDSLNWNGNTYTTSGTYSWIGTNAYGCDSIASVDLTITSVNSVVVIINDTTLQAQSTAGGTTYQWVDCNDNFAPITGETNATFTTQTSGLYAVEVSLNNCSEISDCFTINTSTGINDNYKKYEVKFFPNPTTNDLVISLEGIGFVDILIVDINGKVLMQQSELIDQDRINLSDFVSGLYFIKINSELGSKVERVTKY